MRKFALVPILAAGVIAVLAPLSPAVGAPKKPVIQVDGQGTYELDSAGAAVVTGVVDGEPVSGPYVATLAADDATLPDPGDCEPGSVTASIDPEGPKFLELSATGEVCGEFLQDPFVVTHRFTGRYDVVDGKPGKVLGTDGFVEVVLATEARAHFFAIDT